MDRLDGTLGALFSLAVLAVLAGAVEGGVRPRSWLSDIGRPLLRGVSLERALFGRAGDAKDGALGDALAARATAALRIAGSPAFSGLAGTAADARVATRSPFCAACAPGAGDGDDGERWEVIIARLLSSRDPRGRGVR